MNFSGLRFSRNKERKILDVFKEISEPNSAPRANCSCFVIAASWQTMYLGLSTPKSQIAISAIFPRKGQIARKLCSKSDFHVGFAESNHNRWRWKFAPSSCRVFLFTSGNRSDFRPAVEICNRNRKNLAISAHSDLGGLQKKTDS